MTPQGAPPSPWRWVACVVAAVAVLLVVLGAGILLLFIATPPCDEPRNNVTVGLVRMGLALLGLAYGGAGYALGRGVLRPRGGARYVWYAVLVPGTLLPLIAAAAFRAPAVGDLFCF